MYKRILISAFVCAISTWVIPAQTVELPDTLFLPSSTGVRLDRNGIELPKQLIPGETQEPLFKIAPAVTFKDYIEAPVVNAPLFVDLPDIPSEFFLHVLILQLSKIEIPELEENLAQYRLMLDNFNRNLLNGKSDYPPPYTPITNEISRAATMFGGGVSSGVVVTGCLDPLEAYRRYMQQKRMERAKQVIDDFERDDMPVNNEKNNIKINLPNLLKENNLDIKTKNDGDNPPYRP